MSKSATKTASAAATAAAAMTTPAQLERLGEHLRKLRLLKSGERLEALLQQAAANDLPYAEFLEHVLSEEVAAKTSKNIAMRTAMARFPFVKPLETFDFAYQPSIDRKQLQQLATCHYIEHGDNVIVLGPPGVGKTHLAVSLGLKAIEAGYRVLFTTAASLIEVCVRPSHLESPVTTGKDRVHVGIGGHDDKREREDAAAVRGAVQSDGAGSVRRAWDVGGAGGDVARHQRQRRAPLAATGAPAAGC